MFLSSLAFYHLVTWDRVLGAVWVGDRYVSVVTNRDLRPVRQGRLATFVLVGIFNRLDNVFLFIVRQLGWVIDLYLVAWYGWSILFSVSLVSGFTTVVLTFNNFVTRNRVF